MSVTQVISLLSGVALFLYGMSLMGDGLKRVSGDQLEANLFKLSNTKLKAVLLGTGVTAVIQSSGATSVMAVGFVNSGMMNLVQGISVVIGAILGTSVTGWVICLSYIEGASGLSSIISTTTLTGTVAIIGIYLRMFSKKQMHHDLGDIMMGFVILMFGMSTMSGAVRPVGEQPWFQNILVNMNNPIIGIAVGAAFTAILQSASAAVGIVQALSVTGAMTVSSGLPLLMGINIGASVPVLLSAIGSSSDGKRTAMSYLVSGIISTVILVPIFYGLNSIMHFAFMSTSVNPFSLAFVNTLLRLAITVILLPLIEVIKVIVTKMIAEAEGEKSDLVVLEERFIYRPTLAIEQSRQAITDMAERTINAFGAATDIIFNYDQKQFDFIKKTEEQIDEYEDKLSLYLMQLTRQALNPGQSMAVTKYLNVLSEYESISDYAYRLSVNAKEIHDKKYVFSSGAKNDFSVLCEAVFRIVELTVSASQTDDFETAEKIEPLHRVINELCDEIKHHHIQRLKNGTCSINQGFVYNDMCMNLERVSDHCSNIGAVIIEQQSGELPHVYRDTIHQNHSSRYDQYYDEYLKQFVL